MADDVKLIWFLFSVTHVGLNLTNYKRNCPSVFPSIVPFTMKTACSEKVLIGNLVDPFHWCSAFQFEAPFVSLCWLTVIIQVVFKWPAPAYKQPILAIYSFDLFLYHLFVHMENQLVKQSTTIKSLPLNHYKICKVRNKIMWCIKNK